MIALCVCFTVNMIFIWVKRINNLFNLAFPSPHLLPISIIDWEVGARASAESGAPKTWPLGLVVGDVSKSDVDWVWQIVKCFPTCFSIDPHNSPLEVVSVCAFVCAQSIHLWSTLWNPMDCSPPDSSVHGILQARILEWVAMPFSRGSSQSRDQTWVSHTAGRFFTV